MLKETFAIACVLSICAAANVPLAGQRLVPVNVQPVLVNADAQDLVGAESANPQWGGNGGHGGYGGYGGGHGGYGGYGGGQNHGGHGGYGGYGGGHGGHGGHGGYGGYGGGQHHH